MGEEAYRSLLRAMLQGQSAQAGSVKPVVAVVDLFAHTGDLARAVLHEHFAGSLGGTHLYYLGIHADCEEAFGVDLTSHSV